MTQTTMTQITTDEPQSIFENRDLENIYEEICDLYQQFPQPWVTRLDTEHRHRLLHGYLPVVSGQILLFATDAEADAPFLADAKPYLAHAYRLQFDPVRGDTEATPVQ